MKRKIAWLVLVVVCAFIVFAVWTRMTGYDRATHHGRHAREWAWMAGISVTESNRIESVAALRALGSNAVPPLLEMLNAKEGFYEKPLRRAAKSLPPEQRAEVMRWLAQKEAHYQRTTAINALGIIGPNAAAAIPDLAAVLRDPDVNIRWQSARALGLIGLASLPVLLERARDADPESRRLALVTMGEFRTNAPAIVQVLFSSLADTNESVRAAAAAAIGRIGQRAVPEITRLLADVTNVTEIVTVMHGLGTVRLPLRMATTNLVVIARNSQGALRAKAVDALGAWRAGDPEALEVVTAALDDADEVVRASGIRAAGEIGPRTEAAIPKLVALANSMNAVERELSVTALGKMGSSADAAVPVIKKLLEDEQLQVRASATNALARIKMLSQLGQ